MLRGVGIGASQLASEDVRLQMLSNNLAQVDTPGYCQDQSSEKTFADMLMRRIAQNQTPIGSVDLSAAMGQPSIDLAAGPLDPTGRPLDLAAPDGGFFAVQAPDGVRYTRRGSFHQNGQGQLVSLEGWPVLGQNGPIAGPGPLAIGPTGQVISGGKSIGTLRVVNFPNNATLVRKDDTYLVPAAGTAAQTVNAPNVVTGSLIGSNVDLATSITDLMAASRSYQVAEQAVNTEDGALSQLIDQVNK
ncbi:MAG TPA: flagellar hook-basal body protein [Chloroflexota bacterium]|nr:flagellar hook-basal body protein [Chloroflexota bacterium]